MASIHKRPGSQVWHCSYHDQVSGKWRLRSTGATDKQEALAICLRFESLGRGMAGPDRPATVARWNRPQLIEAAIELMQVAARDGLGEDQAREYVNKVRLASGQEPIEGSTVAEFLDNWLKGKALARSEHTAQRYRTTVKLFKEMLSKRSSVSLGSITARDLERFRDARLKEVGPSTVEDDLKILRTAFNAARRHGLIHSNPVEAVDLPKGESRSRDAFSSDEVRLLLAATKDTEWKTAILLGYYAGLRLGDAVGLDWKNVDLKDDLLSYRASKTRRQEEVPLHPRVKRHLESLRGERSGKMCPRLAAQKVAGRSGLSRQFLEIVERAGIKAPTEAPTTERGRRFSSKTFHSLRHGFISAMANAGIAPELRQRLAGHTTDDVHRKYTHLQIEPLRKAVRSIR